MSPKSSACDKKGLVTLKPRAFPQCGRRDLRHSTRERGAAAKPPVDPKAAGGSGGLHFHRPVDYFVLVGRGGGGVVCLRGRAGPAARSFASWLLCLFGSLDAAPMSHIFNGPRAPYIFFLTLAVKSNPSSPRPHLSGCPPCLPFASWRRGWSVSRRVVRHCCACARASGSKILSRFTDARLSFNPFRPLRTHRALLAWQATHDCTSEAPAQLQHASAAATADRHAATSKHVHHRALAVRALHGVRGAGAGGRGARRGVAERGDQDGQRG